MADYKLTQTFSDGSTGNMTFTIPDVAGTYKVQFEITDANDNVSWVNAGNIVVNGTANTYRLNVTASDGTVFTPTITTPVISYKVTYPAKPANVSDFKIYVNNTIQITNPAAQGTLTVKHGDKVYAVATAPASHDAPAIGGLGTTTTNGKTTTSSTITATSNISVSITAGSVSTYKISLGTLTYGTWRMTTANGYTGYVPYNSTWSIANYLSTDLRNQMVLTVKDPSGNTLLTADYVRPTSDTALIELYYNVASNGLSGTYDSYVNGSLTTASSTWPMWKNNYRFSINESSSSGKITSNKTFAATVTKEPATLTYTVVGTDGAANTSGFRTLKVSGYFKDTRSADKNNMIGLMEQYIYSENHSAACYFEFDNSALPTTLTTNTTLTPVVKQYMRMKTVTLAVSPTGYGTLVYGTSNITSLSVPYGTKVSSDTSRVAFVVDSATYPYAVNNKINGSTEAIVTSQPKSADGTYTYASNGWTNGSGTVTSNITVTAKFTSTPYRVIRIENTSWGTVKYGSTPLSSNARVPDGATLVVEATQVAGSFTEANCSTGTLYRENGVLCLKVDSDETITFTRTEYVYSLTYHGKPTGVKSYKIYKNGILVSENPTSTSGFNVKYSDEVYAIVEADTGYTVDVSGISTNASKPTTNFSGNVNITVTAQKIKYPITIINPTYGTVYNGSTKINSGDEVEYNTTLTLIPTKVTGYTTKVSSSTGTPSGEGGGTFVVNGPETITFTRTANVYEVVFNGNGATSGSMSNQSFTYDVAQNLTAEAFTRSYNVTFKFNAGTDETYSVTNADYTFNGWATSASGAKAYNDKQSVSNLTSTNNGTVTLYANWTPKSITLPTPTRTGYTLKGWSTSSTATSGTTGSYTPTSDVTLYAIWTANTYTLTFNANGGTASITTRTVTYDAKYGTMPTASRTGYAFKGWYTATSGGTEITSASIVKITADTTLYAQWTANVYTVKYHTGLSTSGTLPTSPATFTYPTDVTLGTNSMSKSNSTANSYKVTYAQGNASSTTNLPATQTSINTTTYTRNGWTTGASNTNDPDYANGASFDWNATSTLNLYPNFTTATTNGGVTTSNNTMSKDTEYTTGFSLVYNKNKGEVGTLPDTQTATNTTTYTHTGWATSASGSKAYNKNVATGALSANVTLYPYFDSQLTRGTVTLGTNTIKKLGSLDGEYTITYNYNGNGSANTTAKAARKTMYTSNGWTTTNGSAIRVYTNGQVVQLDRTTHVYPCFTLKPTVDAVTLPNPTRTGYTCSGWYTATSGGTKVGDAGGSYTPISNITLYAQWTPNTHWVFYRNTSGWATGGTLPSDQSRTYPNATTLATNSMTKSNTNDYSYTVTYNYNGGSGSPASATATKVRSYTANGWTTTEKSTTQSYANGASFGANSTTNLTLYPCFRQSTTGGSVTLPLPEVRTGYNFKGWATSSTATSGTTGTYTPTGNVTLYAAWTVKSYILTISSITGVTSQTVTRTSSPLQNAETGVLEDGALIYYGDVLRITAMPAIGYGVPTITSPITVDANIKTSSYITAGLPILSAPVIGAFTENSDKGGSYIWFDVTNNNDVAVNVYFTLIDQSGFVGETHNTTISANRTYRYYTDYWAPEYMTVEVYFAVNNITSNITTATYDNRPTYTVTLPVTPYGLNEIVFNYTTGEDDFATGANSYAIQVPKGDRLTASPDFAPNISGTVTYSPTLPTTITKNTTVSVTTDLVMEDSRPDYVDAAVYEETIHVTFKNTAGIRCNVYAYITKRDSQTTLQSRTSKAINFGQTCIISFINLTPDTYYDIYAILYDAAGQIEPVTISYRQIGIKTDTSQT